MQIHFTGHQVEITDALKAFTEDKLSKLTRHFDRITTIHITFNVEKLRQIVDATVLIPKSELHASSEAENMYTAIDNLVEKLDKQLIKYKEKMDSHRSNHIDKHQDNYQEDDTDE
ncbi:MAG: ribosome-associated translation inhibitor RaiA [Gammaproteobacteria bacterium]|nr:ribosome-associated translation inhibitor RaiA [Gammaproteobacteria bacterium]MCH9716753.1 ribosome-associated translation inhibitor RaiA [Gammaproteobacteria bacterium]MCH9763986.1 ribosome-associated translation inhibitor RaiA [Gammaproteobacteria bacterium]